MLPSYEGRKHNSDSPARRYSTLAIRILHIVDAMRGQYDRMHAQHLNVVVVYYEVISRHFYLERLYTVNRNSFLFLGLFTKLFQLHRLHNAK